MAKFISKSSITFAVILDGSFVDAQDLANEGIKDDRNEILP
jgi:sulfur carrier protein ThiS